GERRLERIRASTVLRSRCSVEIGRAASFESGSDAIEMNVPVDESKTVMPGTGDDEDIGSTDGDPLLAQLASHPACKCPGLGSGRHSLEVLFQVAQLALLCGP